MVSFCGEKQTPMCTRVVSYINKLQRYTQHVVGACVIGINTVNGEVETFFTVQDVPVRMAGMRSIHDVLMSSGLSVLK